MVVATMEPSPIAHTASRFAENGSRTVVAEPAPPSTASGATFGPVELPPKRRFSGATLVGLASVAGLGAIALGAWGVAASVSDDSGSGETPAAVENVSQVVNLIAKPSTATIPIKGSGRRIILVVGAKGYGVLVLNGVGQPPSGKTYEAWIIRPTVKAPAPAGLFAGGTGVVKLTKPVPPGAVVAITVEKAEGVLAPTQQPKLLATRT